MSPIRASVTRGTNSGAADRLPALFTPHQPRRRSGTPLRLRGLLVLILASAFLALVPSQAFALNTDVGITSMSIDTASSGDSVTLYGYGLDNVDIYLGSASTCCYYPSSWQSSGDGSSVSFTVPAMYDDTFTVYVYSYTYGESDSYCCLTYVTLDNDGDGYRADVDCNDADWSIHPGAYDAPYDGIDQDCTGQDTVIPTWITGYVDAYVNGYGDDAQFGVRDEATDGFDQGLDAPQPPAPPQDDHVEAYFAYPANANDTQHLSVSYVHGAPTVTFPLHVEWTTPDACLDCGYSNVLYLYVPLNDIPTSFNVYLVDGSQLVDLRASMQDCCWTSYAFDVSTLAGSHDFQIMITTESVTSIWLNQGWNMVSLPVTLSDTSVAAVFGDRVDAALTWDGQQYVAAETLQPGVGYWVHAPQWSSSPVQLLAPGIHDLTVDLHAGWNLVGAPKNGAPLWNLGAPVSPTGFVWGYNGYYSTSWIWEGSGAWIYATAPTTIQLTNPWSASVRAPAVHAATALPPLTGAKASDDAAQFVLPLRVTDASGAADGATLRATQGAEDGFDAADAVEPPTPAADAWTQASFRAGAMQLDTDVVAPTTKGVYALDVARHGDAGRVSLAWDAKQLPAGYVFELVDGVTRVDMRAASSYAYDAPAGTSTHGLAVVVRPADAPVCAARLDGDCLAQLPFDPQAILGKLL